MIQKLMVGGITDEKIIINFDGWGLNGVTSRLWQQKFQFQTKFSLTHADIGTSVAGYIGACGLHNLEYVGK